jgi:hypothetical protein
MMLGGGECTDTRDSYILTTTPGTEDEDVKPHIPGVPISLTSAPGP